MTSKYHNHTLQTNPWHRHVPAHKYDVMSVSHHLKGNMLRHLSELFYQVSIQIYG